MDYFISYFYHKKFVSSDDVLKKYWENALKNKLEKVYFSKKTLTCTKAPLKKCLELFLLALPLFCLAFLSLISDGVRRKWSNVLKLHWKPKIWHRSRQIYQDYKRTTTLVPSPSQICWCHHFFQIKIRFFTKKRMELILYSW